MNAVAIKKEDVIQYLKDITALEAGDLVATLEETFGVKVEAPQAGPAPTVAVEPVEEQTEFEVVFESVPADKKIAGIKEVRALTGLGLTESKMFVESLPRTIKEGVNKEEAAKVRAVLEALGGKVTVK